MTPKHILFLTASLLAIGLSAWAFAPPGTLALSIAMGATLLALAIIDWRTFILPDPLNLLLALLGLAMIWMVAREDWLHHLIGGVAGYLILLAVELFYRHVRGIDALGRGDAKLLGALGLWVGWTRLPDILLVAAGTGLIAALVASQLGDGGLKRDTPLAFGPWLALSGWICWLAGPLLVPAI
ncbi:prepilin peptidase [Henriciella litoralis]|uniref:prepilin peptidase n=1 Tax=Henriciella litoralis TaxID=568102 RepID=UPI000A032CA2|nr:A24 family peptidase [Henriciella litoralis]